MCVCGGGSFDEEVVVVVSGGMVGLGVRGVAGRGDRGMCGGVLLCLNGVRRVCDLSSRLHEISQTHVY